MSKILAALKECMGGNEGVTIKGNKWLARLLYILEVDSKNEISDVMKYELGMRLAVVLKIVVTQQEQIDELRKRLKGLEEKVRG